MAYTELTVWTRGIIMDSACGRGERAKQVEPQRAGAALSQAWGWGPTRVESVPREQ